jgi:hypothetical protein
MRPYLIELGCWDDRDDDDAASQGDLEFFLRIAEAMQPQTPDELAELIVNIPAHTAH